MAKARIKAIPNTTNPVLDLGVEGNQIKPISPSFAILGGETHDDGGTNINFQGSTVEAQKGEPVSKNLAGDVVAWGKMLNPLTGRLFESDAKLLAKEENKIAVKQDKGTHLLIDNAQDTFLSSLKASTGKVLQDASNVQSSLLTGKKEEYSQVQQTILNLADVTGSDPKKIAKKATKNTDLLKGDTVKVKIKSAPKAQAGYTLPNSSASYLQYANGIPPEQVYPTFPRPYNDLQPIGAQTAPQPVTVDVPNPQAPSQAELNAQQAQIQNRETLAPQPLPSFADQNKLNLMGLIPEAAAVLDRPDYVQGFQYNPNLVSPYQVTFQDQINQNHATFNQVVQSVKDNPAALATLAAQVYQADNQVLANEFRQNQQIANTTANQNQQILNQAQQVNLDLSREQYGKQEQAQANTEAARQAALQSISSKFLQNRAENNAIRLLENYSQFRVNENMQAQNYNSDPTLNYSNRDTPTGYAQGVAAGTTPQTVPVDNSQYYPQVQAIQPASQASPSLAVPVQTSSSVPQVQQNTPQVVPVNPQTTPQPNIIDRLWAPFNRVGETPPAQQVAQRNRMSLDYNPIQATSRSAGFNRDNMIYLGNAPYGNNTRPSQEDFMYRDYLKGVETTGGPVLMKNGTWKEYENMTTDEKRENVWNQIDKMRYWN